MLLTILPSSTIQNDPRTAGALDAKGKLEVMPAAFYRNYTTSELIAFGTRIAAYSFPTTELVGWLQKMLQGLSALEIGAGNGVLAQALGIRAADNWMQTWPDVIEHYKALRQPLVQYGELVEELDAHEAVAKYKPDVVLACWVTHKYREEAPEQSGNMYGVAEEAILSACQTYIHIGNSKTHAQKPIKRLPHRCYRFDWLVSRASQQELNEICIWGARLPGEPPEA